ncbi:hypothetical protein DFQ28_002027 [Apophysomyces sp. BC1034]|nr:hypothetical protein DFQ28_002027 [Apophysomyces sp. BC1034]
MAQSAAKPTLAEMSAAGLRAFFNIAHDWQLSVDEQLVLLGSPGRSTFFKWKAAPDAARLSRDTLERLSHLLGIYKTLQILLPQPEAADGWAISATWSQYGTISTRCAEDGREQRALQHAATRRHARERPPATARRAAQSRLLAHCNAAVAERIPCRANPLSGHRPVRPYRIGRRLRRIVRARSNHQRPFADRGRQDRPGAARRAPLRARPWPDHGRAHASESGRQPFLAGHIRRVLLRTRRAYRNRRGPLSHRAVPVGYPRGADASANAALHGHSTRQRIGLAGPARRARIDDPASRRLFVRPSTRRGRAPRRPCGHRVPVRARSGRRVPRGVSHHAAAAVPPRRILGIQLERQPHRHRVRTEPGRLAIVRPTEQRGAPAPRLACGNRMNPAAMHVHHRQHAVWREGPRIDECLRTDRTYLSHGRMPAVRMRQPPLDERIDATGNQLPPPQQAGTRALVKLRGIQHAVVAKEFRVQHIEAPGTVTDDPRKRQAAHARRIAVQRTRGQRARPSAANRIPRDLRQRAVGHIAHHRLMVALDRKEPRETEQPKRVDRMLTAIDQIAN